MEDGGLTHENFLAALRGTEIDMPGTSLCTA